MSRFRDWGFDNDPFFSDHQSHFSRMDAIMQNPFQHMERLMREPFAQAPALEGPSQRDRHVGTQRGTGSEVATRRDDFFGPSMFPSFNDMFGRMGGFMQQMQNMESTNPDAHVYSESSVYRYDGTGGGQPKIFQARKSTRQGPGGIRETRKALRDSEKELERMAIGHHIGDRSHEIQRSRNTRTGDQDEKQDFRNLAEEDAEAFDHEFKERMQRGMNGRQGRKEVGARPSQRKALKHH